MVFTLFSCSQTASQKNGDVDGSLVQNPATLTSDSTNRKVPEMSFSDTRHDFGKVKEGDKVIYEFRFTNTGNAPLLISNVKASCGCTTPDWPRSLIQPGDSNVIKVEYNSKGRIGEFSKAVEITANTYPNNTTLTISGVVFKD
jgi:hypothetical protein